MNKRIRVKKSLVAKYIARANAKISAMGAGEGIYAYRGQENAEWEVKSAAYRRLESALKIPPYMEMFISHHETKILEPARMNGYGVKDGRLLSDLELLADLQHHGAATCLIDFTCNFLVALWFACTEFKDEDGEVKDGKVFIMNTNDSNIFLSLEQDDLECSIREILTFETRSKRRNESKNSLATEAKGIEYWHWSPHGINPRILKQDGLFIFGKMNIANDKNLQYITIDKKDKARLENELRVWGISREALFKDLPGFASSQGVNVPIPIQSISADELLRAGNAALQRDEIEKAIQLYNEAESKGGANAVLLVSRGSANHQIKEYESAIEDYNKAIDLEPDNRNAHLFLGFLKYSMNDYDSAIMHFRKAARFEETKFHAYLYHGLSNHHMNKFDDAIEYFTKAIEFDPGHSAAGFCYFCRGLSNSSLEKHDDAISDYTQSIKISPNDYRAYYNRGFAYAALNQYGAAIKDYTMTVELDPTNVDAYFNRARAYADMGNHDAAAEGFAKVIELDPEMAIAHYARARSYHELGRAGEAKTSLLRALELARQQKDDDLVQKIQNVLDHLNKDHQGD